jgi:hypothetical protein
VLQGAHPGLGLREKSVAITRTVASLAYLKAQWDQNRSEYIDHFVPFVSIAVRNGSYEGSSIADIQTRVKDDFGIVLPQGTIRTILQRARSSGFVLDQSNGTFCANMIKLSELNFDDIRSELLRKYELLATRLREYANGEFKREWSQSEAETVLDDYLVSFSEEVLVARHDSKLFNLSEVETDRPEGRFVLASFLAMLARTSDPDFKAVEEALEGALVAGALFYPEMDVSGTPLRDLTAYLDTRIVLRALGYAGKEVEDAALELLELCKQQEVSIRVFRQTFDEVERVLQSAARFLANPRSRNRHNEVIRHCMQLNLQPSTVELWIARLEDDLRTLGIRVVDKPAHSVAQGVDENELQEGLQTEIEYSGDAALHHDIDSLTAVHRRRGGRRVTQLRRCTAVFITTNRALVKVARNFFESHYGASCIPIAMLERTFVTLLWVRNPLVAPDLPVKQVISDCFSAMRPSDALWARFLGEVEELEASGGVSREDAALVRLLPSAEDELMRDTLGIRPVNRQTAADVVEATKSRLRAEVEADLSRAPLVADQESAAISQLPLNEEVLSDSTDPIRKSKSPETIQISRLQRTNDTLRRHIRSRATKHASLWASLAFGFVWIVGGLVVIALLLLTIPPPGPSLAPHLTGALRVLFGVLAVLFVVLNLVGALGGYSVNAIATGLRTRVHNWILSRELPNGLGSGQGPSD